MTPAELRELEERAVPAPWEVWDWDAGDVCLARDGDWLANVGDWSLQKGPPEWVKFVQDMDAATAKCIAALRNAAPALIGLWEAAEMWAAFQEPDSIRDQQQDYGLSCEAEAAHHRLLAALAALAGVKP